MSAHFPCTKFHCNDLENFANKDIKTLLSIWGKNILQLKVNIKDPIKNMGILRELLFKKVTNLKKLELQLCKDEDYWNFKERKPSLIKIGDGSNELQHPNLEVLCVNVRYSKFRGVTWEYVTEAVFSVSSDC